ncbi:VOC family protein [Piscinibacter sakaiensis]|uniref:VOC family protein n=1 Tax=Piscinibacter sakaiensis TaxID=1547922 RepID=UPI003AB101E1
MSQVHLQGKFVWCEHLSNDSAAASRFYEQLFDWHTEAMPMGEQRYSMVMNDGDGIGGYREAPAGMPAHWLSYISVADVDAAHKTAVASGAKAQMEPMDMGEVGRGSVITDPTGATVALWNSTDGDRADVEQAPNGSFCWHELWTGDEKAAILFYQQVIGYQHDSMDMGPAGIYHLLTHDGQQRAGVMRDSEGKAPPMWLPYVAVADADASANKAEQLGAKIVVPPTDIPVGRFSVLIDPLGAAIGVVHLQPGQQG